MDKEINIDNLIILNMWDRPCMHLIAEVLPDRKIKYINKILRKRYKELKKVKVGQALRIMDLYLIK